MIFKEFCEKDLMSKKVIRVGLESTTFGLPRQSTYQLSHRCDNGTEAFEIVYTVYTIYTVECIQR